MPHLKLERLRAARLEIAAFAYVIVPGFLQPESWRSVNAIFRRSTRADRFRSTRRQALQMNWMTGEGSLGLHSLWHKPSNAWLRGRKSNDLTGACCSRHCTRGSWARLAQAPGR